MKLRKPTPRALAIGCAAAVALFVVVYEAAGNILLSTGEIARIVSKHPERLRLEYARASTVLPGHVHVEGLTLRGRTPELEWQLQIDSADVRIALLSLMAKRFHATKVAARGVSFRLRFRRDPSLMTPDRIARIPPIDGFDVRPLLGIPPDTRDPNDTPWAIELDDTDASAVREIWIDGFRLTGDVQASGGFTIFGPHLTLDPSHGTAGNATLATGDDIVVANVNGEFDGQIDPVDLGQARGEGILRYFSSHSRFEGKTGGIRFIRHLVADQDPPLDFEGGSGTFQGEVFVDRGIVKKGSRYHVEAAPARVTIAGRTLEAATRVDMTSGEDDGGAWAKADIAIMGFTFFEPDGKKPAASSALTSASVRLASIDLAEPPRDIAYSWETARVAVDDLHTIDRYLPADEPFHFEGGHANVAMRAHGTLHDATGEVAVASTVSMRIRGARITSGVDAKVPMHVDWDHGTLGMGGALLDLSNPAISGGAPRADWSANVKLETAEVHVSPPSFAASVALTSHDGAPFVSLYAAMNDVSPVTRTAIAIVPAPLLDSMTARAHGGLRFVASPGLFDVHALDIRGASSRFRGEIRMRGASKIGGFLIEAGPTATGIGLDGTTSSLVILDAVPWFERHVASWRAL